MPPIIPPHVIPPKSVRTSLKLLAQSARCILETWPEDMYTSETYQPPVKGVLYVMKPDALAQILVSQADKFEQSHLLRRIIKPVWQSGIATSIGAAWRWQRRAAAPVFSPKSVTAIIPAANTAAQQLCEKWRASNGASCEVSHDLGNAAQQVVLDGLLGSWSSAGSADILQKHGADLTQKTGRINYADLLMLPNWTRRFLGPVLDRPAAGLHAEVGARLAALKADDSGPLLHLLAQSKDPETGQVMSQDQLRANIVGSVAAGRETTALAIAWALYLLALDQDAQAGVRAEVDAVVKGDDITAEDLGNLTLTRSVLHEAMRLYPPAPQIVRDCLEDTEVAGISLRKGTAVTIPIYAIHRNPSFWDQPNAFQPDRFTDPEVFAKQNRFRYLPFGGGARVCLGQAFVMTEAVTMLARIIRTLHVDDATMGEMTFETGATLRAKNGINLRFKPI
ncbi:MAG: cytochrome P450 [Planktotalea sp.]|uniref:cytochrome P450 n=1 Tax=Planktotalea sp. TaxID=2029877 RepID=UPI003C731FB9